MMIFTTLKNRCLLLLLLPGLIFSAACSPPLHAHTWPAIRDAVVHIRITPDIPAAERKVDIRWQDAWISEAHTDHIYVLNPDGSLLRKLQLTHENTPGNAEIQLPENGDYQLHVTGASFRNVSVTTADSVASLLEPVRVHKAISLPAKGRLYFRVPGNTPFRFAAKDHGGPDNYRLAPITLPDHKPLRLQLKDHAYHGDFDAVDVPANPGDQIWELRWDGGGKASFWLDQTNNLFAVKKEHLFVPQLKPGQVELSVTDQIAGTVPAIGAALPFTQPPPSSYPLLRQWNLKAANHYTFSDALSNNPDYDLPFLTLYENRFSIRQGNIILARTGRKPVIDNLSRTGHFLKDYLKKRHSRGLLENAYLAFADEPNLNYPSFSHFERDFAALAQSIRQHPDPAISATLLAVPQSSRFLNGPTRSGAEERKGIDWARELIVRHGKWIDAISWHEWMVRDLIDTSRYRDAVESAMHLVKTHRQYLEKEPALIIGQTNISSGKSLSPYEQNTQFAALWWTSVVIQSSLSGALDQLIWFKAADDPDYPKGLATVTANSFTEKPVSHAMTFINSHLGHWVLASNGDHHPEVDLLATLTEDKSRLVLLGVNKSGRQQQLTISLPEAVKSPILQVLNEPATTALTLQNKNTAIAATLDGEAVFIISAFRIAASAPPAQP